MGKIVSFSFNSTTLTSNYSQHCQIRYESIPARPRMS